MRTTFAFLLLAACFGLTASTTTARTAPQARRRVEYSTGSCNLNLTGDKATTVFFVLGLLDEYQGRQVAQNGDRVEGFYCNEPDKAALFLRYLQKLAGEQGIDPAIRQETTQGCLIAFYSKPLTDALNSCYRYTPTGQVWTVAPDGTRRWLATGTLNVALFYKSGPAMSGADGLPESVFYRTRALAYLSGAWNRSNDGASFAFANSAEKADRIGRLLVDLGARDVRLESTFGYVPRTNWVHFVPTQQLLDWLQRAW